MPHRLSMTEEEQSGGES
uniref:Uncharacterized protein n=1 Tax=Acrobeloides nanus TaxID=290746 RepID=A0A914DG18_9BILA